MNNVKTKVMIPFLCIPLMVFSIDNTAEAEPHTDQTQKTKFADATVAAVVAGNEHDELLELLEQNAQADNSPASSVPPFFSKQVKRANGHRKNS